MSRIPLARYRRSFGALVLAALVGAGTSVASSSSERPAALEGAPPSTAADDPPDAAPAHPKRDLNGFTISDPRVPAAAILPGGPPRDGIRAIDEPRWADPESAAWVATETPVVGVLHREVARAYPIHLLEYHQIVNDEIGGERVAVTYDPLTGCPIAFRATAGDRVLHFGVSGLVYESGFLLYDRETGSLWSQMRGEAISGPLAGTRLERLPVRQEPMGVWLYRHPESMVLEPPFPTRIDYRFSRFTSYWTSDRIPFPVSHRDTRYHPKEVVLGLTVDGLERAYLGSILTAHQGRIVDDLAGHKVRVAYDGETGTFSWNAPPSVEVTDAYWFAWKNFHPGTEIWGETTRREGASRVEESESPD